MNAFPFFVILLASGIQAQVPFLGKCPVVNEVQQNFDVNRYLGTWIAIEKYFTIFEAGRKCVEAVYTASDNATFSLHNQMTGMITHKPFTMDGYALAAGLPSEAKLSIHFTSPVPFVGPYWILGTDYDSYAVVWSCTNVIGFNIQLAWVLTRDRNYPQEALDKAHAIFDRNNLSRKMLYKLDQTNCPKYN
ncbi:hypothetical protein WA026_003024 [Henosepilachna vigintioctopunctata]|uniref:Apolipoprotein D n=1 Tax=Henosepilachna vigintioctopunctata TaxID=420089 RepID=A0AAW1TM92_9CUCU